MSKVTIIYHSYQGVTEDRIGSLEESIESGGGEAIRVRAEEADIDDIIRADKFVLACGQPFGTLSGPVKTFLEELWLAEEKEKLEGKPYTFLLNGNEFPEETAKRLQKVGGYFGWNQTQPGIKVKSGEVEKAKSRCRELGKDLSG